METRSRYSTLENQQETITLKGPTLEEVDSSYLGSKVEHTARVERDVRIRLEKAGLRSMVMSVLYGAETWSVTQYDIRRLKTVQKEIFS